MLKAVVAVNSVSGQVKVVILISAIAPVRSSSTIMWFIDVINPVVEWYVQLPRCIDYLVQSCLRLSCRVVSLVGKKVVILIWYSWPRYTAVE